MDLLVLGGTRFLGRHLVSHAIAAGHRVTLFTRGKRGEGLFPQAERLVGDRAEELEPLRGRRWDAVVDTSGYAAADVRRSAELLRGAAGHYCFVSTISVFADSAVPGQDEDAPLHAPDAESTEVKPETYGPMKVACEQAVAEAWEGRALVVRPGIIIGPHDPTNRFPYWCHRLAEGGEVLAPGRPERPVQGIDARDLAAWMLAMMERGAGGTFNTVGHPTPMGEMLDAVARGVGAADARLTWADDAFLRAHEVKPWSDLPFWLPSDENGLMETDGRRALAAGLTLRPLEETARDTYAADLAEPPADARSGGIDREREAELLAAWHARETA
jgi:2'-hydroxyisoflavone reductase